MKALAVGRAGLVGLVGLGLLGIGPGPGRDRSAFADAAAPAPPAQDAPLAPAANAAELLNRFAIDPTHLGKLTDGKPVDDEELAVVVRCLFRSTQWPLSDVQRLAKPSIDRKTLQSQPAEYRGEFFRLQGRVRAVEVQLVPPDLRRRFDIPHFYRCRIDDKQLGPVLVYAREVPRAWREGARLDESGGALALFLKLVPDGDGTMPGLVSARVAWYPDNLLGRLGMDVGLLDTVLNRTPITGEEREAFYQMLAAVGRARPGELLDQAEADLHGQGQAACSVVPLFNQADDQLGRLVVLEGVVRRAIRIVVDQPDIVARLGIDHYYEMDLFTDDSQGNPLVFCVRELPDGMPPGDSGPYAYRVRVAGFFFKTWAYHSSEALESDRSGTPARQLAPLLIGRQPRLCPEPVPQFDLVGRGVLIGLFVFGMGAAWWAILRMNRSKRKPPAEEPPPRFDF